MAIVPADFALFSAFFLALQFSAVCFSFPQYEHLSSCTGVTVQNFVWWSFLQFLHVTFFLHLSVLWFFIPHFLQGSVFYSWVCDGVCVFRVLATLVICDSSTLSSWAGGTIWFTVGGTGTSVLTCVVDTKLTGVICIWTWGDVVAWGSVGDRSTIFTGVSQWTDLPCMFCESSNAISWEWVTWGGCRLLLMEGGLWMGLNPAAGLFSVCTVDGFSRTDLLKLLLSMVLEDWPCSMGVPCCEPVVFGAAGVDRFDTSTESAYIWWWLPQLWASEPSRSSVIQGPAWCHNEHIQWPLGGQLQRPLEVNHHITQEIYGEALATDGRSQHGCGAQVHPLSQLCLSASASHHWRCWRGRAGDRCPWGVDLPQAAAWKGTEDRGLGAHRDMLWPPLGSTRPHVIVHGSLLIGQDCQPQDLWHGHEGISSTDDSDQHPRALSESGPRSTPKTTAEEHLSWLEKVLLPWPSSLTQEPQYGPTRLLAAVVWLHLKCKFFNGSTTKEACTTFEVWAKQLSKLLSGRFTLVDLLELPRANISGLTLWPVREMWLVTSLPLHPPLQEVNVIVTGSSSTGSTKMGLTYDYTWATTCDCLLPPQLSVWLSVTQIGRTKFP